MFSRLCGHCVEHGLNAEWCEITLGHPRKWGRKHKNLPHFFLNIPVILPFFVRGFVVVVTVSCFLVCLLCFFAVLGLLLLLRETSPTVLFTSSSMLQARYKFLFFSFSFCPFFFLFSFLIMITVRGCGGGGGGDLLSVLSPTGGYQISWQVRQLKTSALALSDHGHRTSDLIIMG